MNVRFPLMEQVEGALPVDQPELDLLAGDPGIFTPQIDQQAIRLARLIDIGEGLPGFGVGNDDRLFRGFGPGRQSKGEQQEPPPDTDYDSCPGRGHPCSNPLPYTVPWSSIITAFLIEEQAPK